MVSTASPAAAATLFRCAVIIAIKNPTAHSSATHTDGCGTRKFASRSPPSTRTDHIITHSDHPATFAGSNASGTHTYESPSAIADIAISTPVSGTAAIFAASPSTVARWKYATI